MEVQLIRVPQPHPFSRRRATFHQDFQTLDFLHYEYAPSWRYAPKDVSNRIGRFFTQHLLLLDGRAGAITFIAE